MELLIAIVYFLKEMINSNLDLFYILGLFFFIGDLTQKGEVFKTTTRIFLPVLIYAIFQFFVIDGINVLRLVVNVSKIYLCLFLFSYLRCHYHKLNEKKLCTYLGIFYTLSIPVVILFKSPFFWRFNDTINRFSQTRLQLTYFEPSELSFYISIFAIYLMYFLLENIHVEASFIFLISSALLLILSAGLGGISILVYALVVMCCIYFMKSFELKRIIKIYFLFIALLGVVLYLVESANPLYLRMKEILVGNDSSAIYRVKISFEVMKNILEKTKGVGIGFGNLNTQKTLFDFQFSGLITVIPNSFMYFISEAGIFGLGYLVFFISYVIKHMDRANRILKLPLLVFILTYQIPGGYFTNPINWIICGVVCCLYPRPMMELREEKVAKNHESASFWP